MQLDYWCSRSLVITVEGPDGRQRVEVDKPFARLGSHELSEVLIPDKSISRRRLYFHATDDGVFCVDLAHNKSGTSLRGWLRMDDGIKLGPYRIWAQLGSPAASEVWPQGETMADLEAKETAAEPQPVLVMSIKGKEVARRYLTRQLTVLGRRSPSTLRITSHSVSASHCVLYWKSDVLWVVDLFSGNGTRLQGRPIDVARISPGESLKIGPAELHFVDMFEKLPVGNEVEPAEMIEGREAQDHVDDGQGGEIDDSSPEMAESSALARQREAIERQSSDLEAARAEFLQQKEAWQSKRQNEEHSLKERARQLEEASTLLAADREEFSRLRKEREKEHGKTDERLKELAQELADKQTDLQSRLQAWETKREEDQNAIGGRWEELNEVSAALADERGQFEAQRKAWEEERRRIHAEQSDQTRQLARERTEFLQQREEWTSQRRREDERSGQRPAHDPPNGQSPPVKSEASSPARPAADDTAEVARRLAELGRERNESELDQGSLERGTAESSALANLDGSPRFASLTTIRRGPRWAPANRPNGFRSTVTAFWAGVMIVAVAFSGITGAAVWFHLRPAYTITVQTAAVDENAITAPVDSGLGPRSPDVSFPESVVKSADVLSEVLTKVDGITFSEISRRGDALNWLRDELKVSYSEDTNTVRIGLCGTHVSDLPGLVDAVGEAFMVRLNLPPSARVDSEAVDGSYRLVLTILGSALGLFVPLLLAVTWGRRRRPAAGPEPPRDLA